jgi:hypothetical protein
VNAAPAACIGVDFSSRPSRAKPVVVARGRREGTRVTLQALHILPTLDDFARWLAEPGDWVGAFDFPFGLSRHLVETLGWPLAWPALIAHYAAMSREEIRTAFAAWCDARPTGAKFAHRACEKPAGSSPAMKWVNPPVAYMLHAGVPLLLAAGVHIPGLHDGDRRRVALEGYPGLLARELVGRREADARPADRTQGHRRRAGAGPHAAGAAAGRVARAARGAGGRRHRRPPRRGVVPHVRGLGRHAGALRAAARDRPDRGMDRRCVNHVWRRTRIP